MQPDSKRTENGTNLSLVKTTAKKLAASLLAVHLLGASCGQSVLGILPGVVNDPKNLTLRRQILAYGTKRLCEEMLRRSVPLRQRDEDPIIGRFYPARCATQELANSNLFVQFSGRGYAWSNVTKRIAFEAGGAVEYDQDFLMDGSTMYVYFRQKSAPVPLKLDLKFVENQAAITAATMLGVNPGAIATEVVNKVAKNGFTVLRENSGAVDFGLGIVEKGQRPKRPYEVPGDARLVVANERSEVHQNQRDYAGPFEVTTGGQALYLTVAIDGAPGIDVQIVPRALGEQWLQQYTSQAATTPPPAPPMLDEAVSAGRPWQRLLRVPEGQYYVVFDNTASAGRTAPAGSGYDDRAAMVSYAIEVGSAP